MTRPEWLIVALAIAVWAVLLAISAPSQGSTDVYCFRDPAINQLHGEGFRTASYVLSESFRPVLYSINTPASAWAYMPFAIVFGDGPRSAQVYYLLLSLLADLAGLWLIVKMMAPGKLRLALIALLAAAAPMGMVAAEFDRPENLSLLAICGILWLLNRYTGRWVLLLAGFSAGVTFLVEPMAGLWAALLIGGKLLLDACFDSSKSDRIKPFLSGSVISGLAFLLPIAVTAAYFHHVDPSSLQRFLHHTDYVVDRGAAKAGAAGLFSRYTAALIQLAHGGPGGLLALSGFLASLAAWVWLCLGTRQPARARAALVLLGLVLLVLPVVAFPIQHNYRDVARWLLPFAVALNWAGTRVYLRRRALVFAVGINLLAVIPLTWVGAVRDVEAKASYHEAAAQARYLAHVLQEKGVSHGVVIVPAAQYYLYKPLLPNLYNPDYLTAAEDPKDVAAVVNCNTGSHVFSPGAKPLPDLLAGAHWQRIAAGQQQERVTLLGHRLMSQNWTWACDLYTH